MRSGGRLSDCAAPLMFATEVLLLLFLVHSAVPDAQVYTAMRRVLGACAIAHSAALYIH